MNQSSNALSAADVRKVARLARLELTDAQVEQYREQLSAVLGYMRQLGELDVAGIEPMSHPVAASNRLGTDAPGAVLPTEVLLGMAPEKFEHFLKVPKVLGEGGGA